MRLSLRSLDSAAARISVSTVEVSILQFQQFIPSDRVHHPRMQQYETVNGRRRRGTKLGKTIDATREPNGHEERLF